MHQTFPCILKKMARSTRKKVLVKCMICSEELDEPYQQIFDETGEELKLKDLLDEFYSMKVRRDKNKIQALCDYCLNELIEAYDIKQKRLEESFQGKDRVNNDNLKMVNSDIEEDASSSDFETEVLDEQFMLEDNSVDMKEEHENKSAQEESLFQLLTETPDVVDIKFNRQTGDSVMDQIEGGMESRDNTIAGSSSLVEEHNEVGAYLDLKEYKRSAICSKFEDIIFPKPINCWMCKAELESHTAVLNHTKHEHSDNAMETKYGCLIDSKCESQNSVEELSFHLVFKHYDLEPLTIFVQCPECLVRFSNFGIYNKHSCFIAKNISRAVTKCETCQKDFRSNKRYRFHLQFHLEKHRPSACLICDTMFYDEDTFFEHVKYGHEKNLELTCLTCDKTFSSKKNLIDHQKSHKVVRKFKCNYCPKSYLDKQMLKDHEVAYHSVSAPFQCYICGKCLNKKSLLNKHIMSHDVPKATEVSTCNVCGMVFDNDQQADKHVESVHTEHETRIQNMVIDKAFACEYCEQAYCSEEFLRNHRKSHNHKLFHCHLCPLAYDEFKKLKTHKITHANYVDIRKTFPVMRHYTCDIDDCHSTYLHWTSLRSHKRNKHESNKKRFQCPDCFETFDNSYKAFSSIPTIFHFLSFRYRYEVHNTKIHNTGIHICQFCTQIFNSKMALAVHVARKHNTTKIQCDQCENMYTNDYDLRRHKQSVHQIFKCETCDKVMKNKKNLVVHQRMVHEKLKRFYCQYCNKGYFNQCDKLEHESTVHVKAKRYNCDLCSYSCVYKQSLSIHLRKHRNEAPYKCTLCPKSFRRAYALTLHMRRHNDIRNFVCPYCDAAYPIQGILNSHIKAKHPNGTTIKRRARRTIAISPSKRRAVIPRTTIFIDDDDGLDDVLVNETCAANEENTYICAEESVDDPQAPSAPNIFIVHNISDDTSTTVLHKTENDHDYIISSDY